MGSTSPTDRFDHAGVHSEYGRILELLSHSTLGREAESEHREIGHALCLGAEGDSSLSQLLQRLHVAVLRAVEGIDRRQNTSECMILRRPLFEEWTGSKRHLVQGLKHWRAVSPI